MKTVRMLVIMFLALTGLGTVTFSQPGQQVYIAYPVDDDPPVIDGVLGKDEYKDAMPLRVTFNDPTTPPGIISYGGENPEFALPDNQRDLSFKLYGLYDEEYLYIAVDVRDDELWADGIPGWGLSHEDIPWGDDCVELYIDGDDEADDISSGVPGKEGFQIIKGWGGGELTTSNDAILWEAASGDCRRGYVVEFRVALESIDTIDGPGEASALPGDAIGFTVAVGDDDNGGAPYNWDQVWDGAPGELTDTFGIWDGKWDGECCLFNHEQWWGTLVFATDDDDQDDDDDQGDDD